MVAACCPACVFSEGAAKICLLTGPQLSISRCRAHRAGNTPDRKGLIQGKCFPKPGYQNRIGFNRQNFACVAAGRVQGEKPHIGANIHETGVWGEDAAQPAEFTSIIKSTTECPLGIGLVIARIKSDPIAKQGAIYDLGSLLEP